MTFMTPSRAGSLPHLECIPPVGASLLAKLLLLALDGDAFEIWRRLGAEVAQQTLAVPINEVDHAKFIRLRVRPRLIFAVTSIDVILMAICVAGEKWLIRCAANGCYARCKEAVLVLGRVWARRRAQPYPWATWCNLFPTRNPRWLGAGRDKYADVADR